MQLERPGVDELAGRGRRTMLVVYRVLLCVHERLTKEGRMLGILAGELRLADALCWHTLSLLIMKKANLHALLPKLIYGARGASAVTARRMGGSLESVHS
jgi:hypothetical protein